MFNKNNNDALGIIFPNSFDDMVPELAAERSIASVPFASRYRLCDFIISSMVHSNVANISFMCRKNYHSLMDHLGSGAEFDLARKNGGINIVPPYADRMTRVYNGRVDALYSLLGWLRKCKERYVIMADSNFAMNFDFRKLIAAHKENGGDITLMYRKQAIPKAFFRPGNRESFFYVLDIYADKRVRDIKVSPRENGLVDYSMNICCVERTRLIEMIEEARKKGQSFFTRDVLRSNIDNWKIMSYEYTEYAAYIIDAKSYFKENMALLKEENCDALFRKNRIYTKVRDDNPSMYMAGATARNTMAADGCIIEGTVENSVIFRGVKIGKGAVVRNCILMQDTVIEDGAKIEYVITDKNVKITKNRTLSGNDNYQVFVSKGQTV